MAVKRDISEKAEISANKPETEQIWLVLLTLTHPDLEGPLRLVRDNVDIRSGGNLFNAFAFDIELPTDEEGKVPRGKLRIDNVDKQIVDAVIAIGSNPINVLTQVILKETPDIIEFENGSLKLRSVTCNEDTVEGTLTGEGFLKEPYPSGSINPTGFNSI